jgi:hypothetical protein
MPSPTTSTAKTTSVFLGAPYGYRFNGDNVELHTCVQLVNDTAHQHQWSLQLRASPVTSGTSDPLASHIVAEAPLPPLAEIADSIEPFALTTSATLPAGQGEYNLILALVAKHSALNEEIHDVARFARSERFTLPRLLGNISYQSGNETLQLNVDAIENPRDAGNLSGTLSLELWALPTSYDGGLFHGTPLASIIIGHLAGQQTWQGLAYELTYAAPAAGRWQIVLMLREWVGNGYTTRDYYNFPQPLVIATPLPDEPTEPTIVAASAPETPVLKAEPPIAAKPKPAQRHATPPLPAKTQVKAHGKFTPKAPRRIVSGVSVNAAPADELALVKGITKTAVDAIIAGRPYTTLDQLTKVKGVGTKTLAKIRASLAL